MEPASWNVSVVDHHSAICARPALQSHTAWDLKVEARLLVGAVTTVRRPGGRKRGCLGVRFAFYWAAVTCKTLKTALKFNRMLDGGGCFDAYWRLSSQDHQGPPVATDADITRELCVYARILERQGSIGLVICKRGARRVHTQECTLGAASK